MVDREKSNVAYKAYKVFYHWFDTLGANNRTNNRVKQAP